MFLNNVGTRMWRATYRIFLPKLVFVALKKLVTLYRHVSLNGHLMHVVLVNVAVPRRSTKVAAHGAWRLLLSPAVVLSFGAFRSSSSPTYLLSMRDLGCCSSSSLRPLSSFHAKGFSCPSQFESQEVEEDCNRSIHCRHDELGGTTIEVDRSRSTHCICRWGWLSSSLGASEHRFPAWAHSIVGT
jgi:hypothetical protein